MVDPDRIAEIRRENWRGTCRECNWRHTDIGSVGVSAEARVHLYNEDSEHTVEVYRDGDLMETIETMHETGDEYLGQDSPTLEEREQEHERIAREVADPEPTPNESDER